MTESALADDGPGMIGDGPGMIGDIGATNARFALVQENGKTTAVRVYAVSDYGSLSCAIKAYLADESPATQPLQAVLAVASPVTGDEVTLTNHPWTFSIEALRQRLGLERLQVINDFAAIAVAIPHLRANDCIQIGEGTPAKGAPIGIIGPGTGLGVGALIPSAKGAVTIASEGGHVTMSPATSQESAILDLMRKRYDHVSAERLLSGPGLVNLYNVLCELMAQQAVSYTADQITNPATWVDDPHTKDATSIFCAMLGTIAGNLALSLGARGGIYISGGIVPRIASFFSQSGFRSRFEAKGRMRGYVAAIPTYLIIRPLPALIGARALLREPQQPFATPKKATVKSPAP
jgi:glucokinase